MSRGDLKRLSKDELIELVLKLQRPAKTSRTSSKPQVIIESWQRHYNTIRPHGSIGYKPPAPAVFVPAFATWPAAQSRPAPPAMLTLAPRPTLN